MSFQARPGQDEVMGATDPVLVVLGGAGTGKTTTAAALVRAELDQADARGDSARRGLFVSFSRAAVTQIVERSASVLGLRAADVQVTTFHAFAWQLLQRWGPSIGLPDAQMVGPAEAKLLGANAGITYAQLLPLASRILDIPAIRRHLEARWAVIVCDEFQDTSDEQFELITRIRGGARLVLLGDLNQCIYRGLPGVTGVGPERVDAALALPGARRIDLPEVSHRDPTNTLPAAAAAIRRRTFDDTAIRAALDAGMLDVRHIRDASTEGAAVAGAVRELLSDAYESVAIFSHHVDATADLSDVLRSEGIEHEIVGLPDAVTSAFRAQFEMIRLAAGAGDEDHIWRQLAVFVASLQRGAATPVLARMILGTVDRPASLDQRLNRLRVELAECHGMADALKVAADTPTAIGLDRGDRPWRQAAGLLRSTLGPRASRMDHFAGADFPKLEDLISERTSALLTSSEAPAPAAVQLMGLHQSKGRESDATIVVLRDSDYLGREAEPMPSSSRLMYVVLTRARRKTIVLAFGKKLSALIEPIAALR